MICPNKNSREWKQLVNQVGNRLANMAFVANAYEIPDVQKLSDIKKSIKWPTRGETENFANVSKNLLIYNKKHGTSHSFTKERIFGNTFKLILNPNYLSVNAEKQRQRLALREANIFKVEDFRTEGFENVYTPSISEQTAGWFNEEGDFLPNEDRIDELPSIKVKKGVSELFESNPELANIGTPEQYSQYLDSELENASDILIFSTQRKINTKKNLEKLINTEDRVIRGAGEKIRKGKKEIRVYKTTTPMGMPNKDFGFTKSPGINNYFVSVNTKDKNTYTENIVIESSDKILAVIKKYNIAPEAINSLLGISETRERLKKLLKSKSIRTKETFVNNTKKVLRLQKNDVFKKYKNITPKNINSILDELGVEKIVKKYYRITNPKDMIVLGTEENIENFKNFLKKDTLKKLPGEINTDELVSGAPSRVADAEKVRKQKIEKEIAQLQDNLNQTSDVTEYTKIHTALENKRIELEADPVTAGASWNDKSAIRRVAEAGEVQAYETILKIADGQLKEVKELIANDAVSYDNVQYSQRIVNLWLVAGDFSVPADEHLLLDEAEFNTESIKDAFRLRKNEAETLQGRLTTLQTNHITKFVRKYTSEDLTVEEIYAILEDADILQQRFLNVGRTSDPMLQAIFIAVGEANTKARIEANDIWKKLDDLTKAFTKAGGNFNMFKQLTKNGSETRRLVFRFSPEFFKRKKDLTNFAFHQKTKGGVGIKNPGNIRAYYDWINRNTITFNSQLLFPDSVSEDFIIPEKFLFPSKVDETKKEAHIQELKTHLGEKGYEFYIKRQEQKIEKFKQKRAAIYTKIQAENSDSSQAEKDALFSEWLREYSPYWGIEMSQNPKARQKGGDKGFYTPKGFQFREQVPKRIINGKETKWYDKNFEKIESNDAYLNYYNFLIETLNQLRYTLPKNERDLIGLGVIPTIKKSILEAFSEKGVMMGITPFWDKFKELQTTTDFSTEVSADIDPKTKDIKKYIQIPFIPDTDKRVRELVRVKEMQYKKETGKAPGKIEKDKFTEEVKDSLSKEQSWDLTKILKAYSLSTLAHKHKSFIQPQIEMAVALFNKRAARELNKVGRPLTKTREETVEDVEKIGGLPHYKSALKFFLDSDFYSSGARKVEGPSSMKRYSHAEKIKKKELEALLETETDDEKIAFLKEQLDQLGGTVTMSAVGDMFLKAMTFKGLGWNIFSAFSNIGFGVISNIIQGSDGREYSQNNLRKAYMLTLNSVARNATFSTWDGVNGVALKIRTLMDNWDLLKTSNQELYDMSVDATKMKKLKRFGPMSPQERSEYLNYAPTMIAIMLEFKATDPDGKEVTLWDAYDKDGKLKEGFKADDVNKKEFNELKLIQKIKRVIEMNHGDYMNPLQIKEILAGRAFSQFRTWMFEGFANRFESGVKADGTPKIDWMLSYGNKNPITQVPEPYVRKGRYRSYTAGQLAVTGSVVGSLVLPGIGTAVGGALGGFIGSFSKTKAEGGIISDVLFTLKQLNRKLINAIPYVSTPTEFHKRFSTVDAANMRKNMTELYLLLILTGVGLLLKAMFTDDDEEDDPVIANFLLSQVTRLTTDIKFYTSPIEAEKLTKTALPVFQLLQDIATVTADVAHYFNDDPKDDVFRSGPFKGESKFWVHFQETFPGTVQYKRWQRIADKAIE